jgi:glycosyltransferase involved in cell wall biosynthesis
VSAGDLRARVRPLTRRLRSAVAWLRGAAAFAARSTRRVPVVGFGQRVPSRREPASGGIVKLQDLHEAFRSAALRYNVLYLVTSRLPDGAVAQARWAQRKGARVIVNQNGVAYPAWYGDGWRHENAPMTQLLAIADHVLYQSSFCKLSADRFAGPCRSSWEVLFNAADTRRFTPATARSGATLTLLLGGSQDSRYRVDAALQVLSILTRRGVDVRLLVTGRIRWIRAAGDARRETEARVRELGVGDRVTFLGPYSQADAPELFRRADILLHTKYNDPCPAVVIEAMASGLPVVYSHSGGVPELVGGDAGIGIEAPLDWHRNCPPDPTAMADAVLAVADRLRYHSDAARQRAVDALDLRHWIARHRAVFEEAAA